MTARLPLQPGEVLHGYCGGFFGRDAWGPMRVEAVGTDWIVCRDDAGHVQVAEFSQSDLSRESIEQYIKEWLAAEAADR